jgi:hypothetical protein
MTKEQEEQESFRVTDKRNFQEDGESRNPDVSEKKEEKPSGEPPSEAKSDASEPKKEQPSPAAGSDASEPKKDQMPPIDFPSYILSYYTQGLVLLGEVPSPYSGKKEEDIEASRHTIDILTLLQEKTKGNLRQDEEQLLENVLYELRMKYMAKTNKIKL